jgi:hypothetical protein
MALSFTKTVKGYNNLPHPAMIRIKPHPHAVPVRGSGPALPAPPDIPPSGFPVLPRGVGDIPR